MDEPPPHPPDPTAVPAVPVADGQRVLLVTATDAHLVGRGVPVVCHTVDHDAVVLRLREPDHQRRVRAAEHGMTTAEIHTGHLVDESRATRLDITGETARTVLAGTACTVDDEHGTPVLLRLPTPDEFRALRARDMLDRPPTEADIRLATTPLRDDGSDDDARTAESLDAAYAREAAVEIYCTRRYLRNQVFGQVVTGLDQACKTARRLLRTQGEVTVEAPESDFVIAADLESARRMIIGLVHRLTLACDGPVPVGASTVPDEADTAEAPESPQPDATPAATAPPSSGT